MYIIHMPIHDGASGARSLCVERCVFAIDQAQFVLVVANAKLTVAWAMEVRFDAQQLIVVKPRNSCVLPMRDFLLQCDKSRRRFFFTSRANHRASGMGSTMILSFSLLLRVYP